jgi:hypothetical protein
MRRSFGKTNSETTLGRNESGIRKTAITRIQRATGDAPLDRSTCV